MTSGKPITDLRQHFESKVSRDLPGGHWTVPGKPNNKGYKSISVGGGQKAYAHRIAYELFVGEIPVGLVIDHKCEIKWCCNPDHLEPVTNAENLRRAHKTCRRGHPFAILSSGRRWCPECQRLRRGFTRGCPGK
jgi:hypothetical protein